MAITATTNIHAEAERIAAEVFSEGNETRRPTPEQIDDLAQRLREAKLEKITAAEDFDSLEEEAIRMVTTFGIVPPNAEKSRRLKGRLAELTVTKSDTITIDDARVIDLRDALSSVGRPDFFKRLFTVQSKFEIVDGAENALKSESLPKRLAEKVLNMFGRCISVKAKKPSLKVVIADPAKPAKKSRAKKGTPSAADLDRLAEEQRIASATEGGVK